MAAYFYTYKNEYDVIDVGCIEAASDRECSRKIKQIGIKPKSIYLNESWVGFEFAFKYKTKFKYKYRGTNKNRMIFLSKTKDWRFCLSFWVLVIIFLSLPLSIEQLTPMFFVYFLTILSLPLTALILYFFCYYELNIDAATRIITKQKKIVKLKLWEKQINTSNAKIHVTRKIVCDSDLWCGGFEKLYVTQIELPAKVVAISSSCQEDSEFKLAKKISETLSLPLLFDDN